MLARSQVSDPSTAMSEAELSHAAEIFVARGVGRRTGLGYRRFAQASEAIAYAVEEFATARPDGVVMVVGDKRFNLGAIRSMHRIAQDRLPAGAGANNDPAERDD